MEDVDHHDGIEGIVLTGNGETIEGGHGNARRGPHEHVDPLDRQIRPSHQHLLRDRAVPASHIEDASACGRNSTRWRAST